MRTLLALPAIVTTLGPELDRLCADPTARHGVRRASLVGGDGVARAVELTLVDIVLAGEPCTLVLARDVEGARRLRDATHRTERLHGLIGVSPAMREVSALVGAAAQTLAPVLVTGATGTGKEVVARAIHLESPRRDRPFVAVNCGALPEGLIESELFGHARGAFTGAHRDKRGQFTLADGGTIFLDEIGDLPMAMQVKLLRVLQDKRVLPVGGEHPVKVDVRVIAATNRDLLELIRSRLFRDDLYYRLCVVPIHLPPLHDRGDDVLRIAEDLLERLAAAEHRAPAWLTPAAARALLAARWPGNVRELANVLHYAVVRCGGGPIEPHHLPATVHARSEARAAGGRPRKLTHADVEEALHRAHGSKTSAARLLGVSRATFYRYQAERGRG